MEFAWCSREYTPRQPASIEVPGEEISMFLFFSYPTSKIFIFIGLRVFDRAEIWAKS